MLDMQSDAMKSFLNYTKLCLIKKGDRSESSSDSNEEFIRANRLIKLLCKDSHLQPRRCAEMMNEKYGYDLSYTDVVNMFKNFHISKEKRYELLEWANDFGQLFMIALNSGHAEDYDAFVAKRKEAVHDRHGDRPKIQDCFACMKLCTLLPDLGKTEQGEMAEKFGPVLAKYFLFDITDALADYCQGKNTRSFKNAKSASQTEASAGSAENNADLKKRIAQLEQSLERSDMMLRDLQDEFDERLEESKVKEQVEFFSRLNSEKYGCILDELLNVRRGVSQLKKQHCELPPEIGGLLIMTQKLTQFVRDSGINPIMKPQEVKTVKVTDIDFCDYDGKPFANKDERKKIKVISPGWIYSDKDIQIARPKVKEATEDE